MKTTSLISTSLVPLNRDDTWNCQRPVRRGRPDTYCHVIQAFGDHVNDEHTRCDTIHLFVSTRIEIYVLFLVLQQSHAGPAFE